jgi:hypothetical protein
MEAPWLLTREGSLTEMAQAEEWPVWICVVITKGNRVLPKEIPEYVSY